MTIMLLLVASMLVGYTNAQPASIESQGNKVVVTGSDLTFQPQDGGVATSMTGIKSQFASVTDQIKAITKANDATVTDTANIQNRLDALETYNTTQATLNIANLSQMIQGIYQQQDLIISRIDKLQGVADEIAADVTTKAAQTSLDALIKLVETGSAGIQKFTDCNTKGGTLVDDTCVKQVTQTKAFTCADKEVQYFAIPNGVTSVHIKAWGGGGAGSSWNTGGSGGYSEGDRSVSKGNVLTIVVACSQPTGQVCLGDCGQVFQPGWPGTLSVYAASCGGGYSGVFNGRLNEPDASKALAIAGGGGGGGGGGLNYGVHRGGAGGGEKGQDGTVGRGKPCDGGKGGDQDYGGAKGCLTNGGRREMTDGSSLMGGRGADGGGGGAGYYGGGGGTRSGNWLHGGGGGGSGYVGGLENASMHGGTFDALFAGAASAGSGYQSGVAVGGVGTTGGPGLVVLKWTSTVTL